MKKPDLMKEAASVLAQRDALDGLKNLIDMATTILDLKVSLYTSLRKSGIEKGEAAEIASKFVVDLFTREARLLASGKSGE